VWSCGPPSLRSTLTSPFIFFLHPASGRKPDCRFKTIFPRATEGEKRLFQLLKKAYIESRYALDYKVSKEDLEYLSYRVTKLRAQAEMVCKEKIESF
jgi:uncharacterized protein